MCIENWLLKGKTTLNNADRKKNIALTDTIINFSLGERGRKGFLGFRCRRSRPSEKANIRYRVDTRPPFVRSLARSRGSFKYGNKVISRDSGNNLRALTARTRTIRPRFSSDSSLSRLDTPMRWQADYCAIWRILRSVATI